MVKIVDMTSALQQVREKAPNTADAMKRFKSGNAGFTDKSHLKAKGLIPRADGTKKVSPKYEDLDKKDVATIKPIIKQLQKSAKFGPNYPKISEMLGFLGFLDLLSRFGRIFEDVQRLLTQTSSKI